MATEQCTDPSVFTASIRMRLISCAVCGVHYAVPANYDDYRRRDNATVRCPKGHKWHYTPKDEKTTEELQAENKALRDSLMRARHDAEQAEARLSEARQQMRQPVTVMEAGEPQGEAPSPIEPRLLDSGRVVCPWCESNYANGNSLYGHIRHSHPEHENIARIVKRQADALQKASKS